VEQQRRRLSWVHVFPYTQRVDETDADIDGHSWPENAWRKLPGNLKVGKKTLDGWPVREVSEGHVSRWTSSVDEASPNGNKQRQEEAHGECGLATLAQRMPSSQSENACPDFFLTGSSSTDLHRHRCSSLYTADLSFHTPNFDLRRLGCYRCRSDSIDCHFLQQSLLSQLYGTLTAVAL